MLGSQLRQPWSPVLVAEWLVLHREVSNVGTRVAVHVTGSPVCSQQAVLPHFVKTGSPGLRLPHGSAEAHGQVQ